jgi:type IV pilus assembly PilX-like protein
VARPKQIRVPGGEEGMALVIALLILLALTVLGSALMLSVNTDTRITSAQLRDNQTLGIAEAGVQEAMLRIRDGEVPDNMNKRQVSLIYEAPTGSIPASGQDTMSMSSLQPTGSYLGYSGATKTVAQGTPAGLPPGTPPDLRVLTVRYKTMILPGPPADTEIVRYDDSHNPKFNTVTGTPVFQIIATGTKGTASRSVLAEVTRSKFNIQAKGAVVSKVSIQFNGNINICGHDHVYQTPVWAQPGGGGGNPDCNGGFYNSPPGPNNWWAATAHGTCMPGAWSSSSISKKGAANTIGEPRDTMSSQAGFYSGPWDCVGMNQADFWSWVGTSQSAPAVPNGIYYLDNNGVKQDQSGSWAFSGGNGDGFLYCDGDLQLNGNFTYKGLIYVEGDFKVNGNIWILGGLVVNGKTVVKIANGSATILYSGDAIQQTLTKYGGNMRMLTWREF